MHVHISKEVKRLPLDKKMDKPLALILVGAFVIGAGLLQIIKSKSYQNYALDRGVTDAHKTVNLSSLILICTGIAIMIPDFSNYGLYGLAGFLVLSAISIHQFWDGKDSIERVSEALHFGKNIGMAAMAYCLTL